MQTVNSTKKPRQITVLMDKKLHLDSQKFEMRRIPLNILMSYFLLMTSNFQSRINMES